MILIDFLLVKAEGEESWKRLCPLQSLPTLGRLYHEGFACSHLGVSSIWFSCFHLNRDTPSLLLHTTRYITPDSVPNPFGFPNAARFGIILAMTPLLSDSLVPSGRDYTEKLHLYLVRRARHAILR